MKEKISTRRWQFSVRDVLFATIGLCLSLGTLRVVLTTPAGGGGGPLLWISLLLLSIFTLGATAGSLLERIRRGEMAAQRAFWVWGIRTLYVAVSGLVATVLLLWLS